MNLKNSCVVKQYKGHGINVTNLLKQMEMVMNPIERNVFVCEMIGMSMDNKGKILVIMELMEVDLQNLIT
jgi:hypothetical protein